MEKESNHLDEEEPRFYDNRFELVEIAAKRARLIREGKKKLIGGNSDKEPVIALRELLSGRLKVEVIRENDTGGKSES